MPTLPTPGGDVGVWGTELNEYIEVDHKPDGKHKKTAPFVTVTDHATVQAALDAAAGGTCFFPSGTYNVSLNNTHPLAPTVQCGVRVHDDTVVLAEPGAILKANSGAPSQVSGTTVAVMVNHNMGTGHDITVIGLTVDGNSANQAGIQNGIFWHNLTRGHHERVTVRNCRGTSAAGAPNESFHIWAQGSSELTYKRCLVTMTDAGPSASGIGANNASLLFYDQCRATGMTVGNGFSWNTCTHVEATNCWARQNALHGFNVELSNDAKLTACIAGGKAVTSSLPAYPFTSGQNLGNTGNGFAILGSTNVTLVDCTSTQNTAAGAFWNSPATGGIDGGSYLNNSATGIDLSNTSAGNVWITPNVNVTGNTTAQLSRNSPGPGFFGLHGGMNLPAPVHNTAVTNPLPWPVMLIHTGTFGFINLSGINVGTRQPLLLPFGASVTPDSPSGATWTVVW